MSPDLVRKLSKLNEASSGIGVDNSFLPPNFSSDVNIWNSVNLSGRREVPLYVDEPRFIVLNEGETFGNKNIYSYNFITKLETFFHAGNIDDPFIPQRGKKFGPIDYKNTPFLNVWPNYPIRNKIQSPDDMTPLYVDNKNDDEDGLSFQNQNNNRKYIKSKYF